MPTISIDSTPEGGPRFKIRLSQTRSERAAAQKAGTDTPPPMTLWALVDTGSSQSFVDRATAKILGLQSRTEESVRTPSTSEEAEMLPSFEAALVIPHPEMEWEVSRLRMIGADLTPQGLGAILGRDVLCHLYAYWDGPAQKVCLSF